MNKTIVPLIETYPEEAVRDGLYEPHKRDLLLKHVAAELTVRAAVALPEIKPIFTGSVRQCPRIEDLLGEGGEHYPVERGSSENLRTAKEWKDEHEDSIWSHVSDKLFPMEA